jgi:hypothetical protein
LEALEAVQGPFLPLIEAPKARSPLSTAAQLPSDSPWPTLCVSEDTFLPSQMHTLEPSDPAKMWKVGFPGEA